MFKILVSLGSNIYSKQNIDKARRMLAHYFPDVIFTPAVITIEDSEEKTFPFRNVLAVFNSELPHEEIIQKLKSIEYSATTPKFPVLTGNFGVNQTAAWSGKMEIRCTVGSR